MSDHGDSDAERLALAIRQVLKAFTVNETRFRPAEGRMRYNPVDFQSIDFIKLQPGCRSSDLSEFLGVSPTTTQSALDRLVKRGLVKRERSKTDKRAVSLNLTAKGLSISESIRRQDRKNCEFLLSILNDKEQNVILDCFDKFAKAVNDPSLQ